VPARRELRLLAVDDCTPKARRFFLDTSKKGLKYSDAAADLLKSRSGDPGVAVYAELY
jgi:hypothetical protein